MSNFIKKFFGELQSAENRRNLEQGISIEFPKATANAFMDYMLERQYLSDVAERNQFIQDTNSDMRMGWVRLCRLPIHPNQKEEYNLFARWQSVLASLHTWQDKLIFLLQRENGYTSIYLGVKTYKKVDESIARLETALNGCMPGISIALLSAEEKMRLVDMNRYKAAGAVTGIPSFRKDTQYSVLQTLDQLAFGVKDKGQVDVDFTVMVIADPLTDEQIANTISRYQQIGSDIHSEVKQSISDQEGTQKSRTNNGTVNMQTLVATLASFTPTPLAAGTLAGAAVLAGISGQHGRTTTISFSRTESKEYLNKFAEYTEKMTDKHCERLRNGRNLGFWNVGVYVLSDLERNVGTVLGMLRSVYSGDESYIEPIRIHLFSESSGAINIIKNFNLIPLADPQLALADDWHVLGQAYQYLSTPLNTQELSLATSLPRNDVPGLRFVKTAVRFANNPGQNVSDNELVIGKIKDYGIVQNIDYKIDVNALVRHSLIVGSTGSGKTCTCKTIIENALRQDKRVLIIEPAKDEYVSWAMKLKKTGAKINIYMPGVTKFGGEVLEKLKLNPFQPAAYADSKIDMLSRCEKTTALINASLPNSDVLPIIMDETFYTFMHDKIGEDFMQDEMQQLADYPKIEEAVETARKVLKARGYEKETSQSITAAVETRLTYLSRGTRGSVLNVNRSTEWSKLFDSVTVINLSHIANQKDRALIMSLLLVALQEYRISQYACDEKYRDEAQRNQLMHLTVVEEAHNVLAKPEVDFSRSGSPQQVVADLFSNMLSEIRAYGEGLMIVDQVPTKLIPDVIKNTNYKICHRLASRDDSEAMATALALRDDQIDIIPTLEVGNAIVSGDKDDAAAWVQINH